MNSIELLKQWVEEDRRHRNNSIESDFDQFCEERNVAIEELLYLAKIGQATEKAFSSYMFIEANGFQLLNVDELLEWANEEKDSIIKY